MMNRHRFSRHDQGPAPLPIPFPMHLRGTSGGNGARDVHRTDAPDHAAPETPAEILAAIESVSRRIDDLARELNCLGYFDDRSDRPRAA